ncbi:hypothetical protein Taro_048128 [Colocasia esculenta]|uniref:Uncharacterized protein n=1 Tax=Colocasia esculenta TaxID=4460 RepID=A0A843WXN0_COLES|nr:hypothetical protein [Colocasia esculenta]
MGRLPSNDPGVERPAARGRAWERRRGARRRWPCVVKALRGFGSSCEIALLLSPFSPPPCGVFVWFVGGPGLRIPLVCLPAGVTTAWCVATSEEASARLGSTVATPCPVVIRLSRCPLPSRWCHDGLGGRDSACVASGVSVAQLCVGVCPRAGFALRTF